MLRPGPWRAQRERLASATWSSLPRRGLSVVALFLFIWAIAAAALPKGLPAGVVLYGIVLGSLTALTAMGLVVIYRSGRFINFAQAEIGALAATVAVILVVGEHWPYFAALAVGLAAACVTGAYFERTIVRPLSNAPRLILTVATIGIAEVVGAAEIYLPRTVNLRALDTFTTPFTLRFTVGPIVFTGDHVVAMVVVPAILVGLAFFLARTDLGIAIRGAADSNDRALLLGIPVQRLSLVVWVLAAGLSGVGAMLSAPILGPQLGVLAGPVVLLAPLTAAVLARMDSLVGAFVAALGIGIFEQAVFWSYPRSSTVDVALFVLVLVGLLVQRRRFTRADEAETTEHEAFREVRPVPAPLRRLTEVRLGRVIALAVAAGITILVPLAVSDSKRTLFAYMAIFGILAVSLVILTGWSGQISLGQFAFAGVGAGTTATLYVHAHTDLFVALACGAAAAAIVAVVIGVPAIRIPGLFLAVATLAFAVPVSTFLLNSAYFPGFTPQSLLRPSLLQRFDLNNAKDFYYFCLFMLAVAIVVAWNFRRTRPGRAVLAVRENDRAASSFAINPVRAKLTAFAFSGALAGVAGGLYVIGLRGIGFAGYNPDTSLLIFVMVVIGGMGSLLGAVLGAVYLQGAQYFLHSWAQEIATGGGILIVLRFAPTGLGGLVYDLRDRALRVLARRRGLSVPSLAERAAFTGVAGLVPGEAPETAVAGNGRGARATAPSRNSRTTGDGHGREPLLACRAVEAGYGRVPVLFGVDLDAAEGETLALLGTNGAGKSTVLRVLSGLNRPSRGQVLLGGTDITRMSPTDRVRAGLVMLPGGRGVFPSLTVTENLRLAGWVTRKDRAFLAEATERVFALFPVLRDRAATKAGSLSGGEQQMLTLAQAILCRPKVLMIDELSLGLAPTVVGELARVVQSLASSGVTVVVVEQSLNVAASIASRAMFMERGQVRFTGATAELASRPDLLRSVFLGATVQPKTHSKARRSANGPGSADQPGREQPITLEAMGITKHYDGVAALDGVDLSVRAGEILGIIGANGAGKTTLFDVCSGFTVPDRGRVILSDADVTARGASERAEYGMGRAFQSARLFPALTVAETLAVACERHVEVRDPLACTVRLGCAVDSEQAVSCHVDELIERFGLTRYRDAFISELSTGTRRVVELAAIAAHGPSVLLLDEPSSGIAQRESEALAGLLLQVRDETGAAVIVIEHDVPLVSSIANRMICLDLGQVLAEGTPANVLADQRVIGAYLGTDETFIARSGALPSRVKRRGSSAPKLVSSFRSGPASPPRDRP